MRALSGTAPPAPSSTTRPSTAVNSASSRVTSEGRQQHKETRVLPAPLLDVGFSGVSMWTLPVHESPPPVSDGA